MTTEDAFLDIETMTVDLGPATAVLAKDAGPRILGYARSGGPQLFATLPDAGIEVPGGGRFHFLGGHRLWRAPEVPEVTYQPDDHGTVITESVDSVELTGAADGDGIVKSISLTQRDKVTVVDHVMRNEGWSPVRSAPWAITQFAPGGVGAIPLPTDPADPHGALPNRSIVLWPYTDPSSPELELRTDEIRMHGSNRPVRTKVGTANRRGWLAYHLDGEVFVKWAAPHRDGGNYLDFGASAQCYRDERFVELETLGPLTNLHPGKEVRHREVWTVHDLGDGTLDEFLAGLPIQPPEMNL